MKLYSEDAGFYETRMLTLAVVFIVVVILAAVHGDFTNGLDTLLDRLNAVVVR